MGSVQVADLGGPVRWRAVPEGPDVETPSIIPVGRPPAGLRDVDPLDGPLDPHRAYVATVSWSTPPRTVEVEFRPGSLLPGRVATEGGLAVAEETFADEADRRCIGGWLWVFGGIALALAVVVVAVVAIGIVVVARIARARRSDADDADEVDLDELSDR
jgi:hypothetical protein